MLEHHYIYLACQVGLGLRDLGNKSKVMIRAVWTREGGERQRWEGRKEGRKEERIHVHCCLYDNNSTDATTPAPHHHHHQPSVPPSEILRMAKHIERCIQILSSRRTCTP